jgi:hypothetical protein
MKKSQNGDYLTFSALHLLANSIAYLFISLKGENIVFHVRVDFSYRALGGALHRGRR